MSPLLAKVNKGHNAGTMKGILTKFELGLCIEDMNIMKKSQNIWPRESKVRALETKKNVICQFRDIAQ
jgi:hypothetical protein